MSSFGGEEKGKGASADLLHRIVIFVGGLWNHTDRGGFGTFEAHLGQRCAANGRARMWGRLRFEGGYSIGKER